MINYKNGNLNLRIQQLTDELENFILDTLLAALKNTKDDFQAFEQFRK